jgi:hypothetical protein
VDVSCEVDDLEVVWYRKAGWMCSCLWIDSIDDIDTDLILDVYII